MAEAEEGLTLLLLVVLEDRDFPEVLGVEAQLVVLFQEHLAAQAQLVQHVKERLVVMEFKCLIHVHTQVVEAELVVLLPERLVVLEKLLL